MKQILTLVAFLSVCLGLSAGTPNGPSHSAHHRVFVNQPVDLQQFVARYNAAARAHANQRSVEWKLLAEEEDKYDDTTSSWTHVDSLVFGYDPGGVVDSELEVIYTNGNWQNAYEIGETANSAGVLIYALEVEWNSGSSSWVNYAQENVTLDAHNNTLQSTEQVWVNNAWVNSTQSIYTWDANNNQLTHISQNWNTHTNAWVNNQKNINTWDANNAQLTGLVQMWDTTAAVWDNNYQDLYTNNSAGEHTVDINQQWKYGMWENYVQDLYNFDTQGNDTLQIHQTWDSADVQWQNSYKYNYTYDANNNNTYELYSGWDGVNLVWVNNTQYTFTFVNVNLNSTELDQYWNTGSSSWVNEYKNNYTYDGNFNKTGFTDYYWSTVNNNWQGNSNYSYTYDVNNNNVYQLEQSFNTTNLTFENTYQYFYYYKQLNVTAINEVVNQISTSLYPNPSTGKNVELQANMEQAGNVRVGLYNAEGKLVTTAMHQFTAGVNTLPLNYNVAAGLYYVQVLDYTTGKSSVLKLEVR